MEKFETAIEFESNDKRVFASDFSETIEKSVPNP